MDPELTFLKPRMGMEEIREKIMVLPVLSLMSPEGVDLGSVHL